MKTLMRTVCMVSGLICALAAANIGLGNFFGVDLVARLGSEGVAHLVQMIFGLSGFVSLGMYIADALGFGCGCE